MADARRVFLADQFADRHVGDGLLGSQQKPGWLTRFFNWVF